MPNVNASINFDSDIVQTANKITTQFARIAQEYDSRLGNLRPISVGVQALQPERTNGIAGVLQSARNSVRSGNATEADFRRFVQQGQAQIIAFAQRVPGQSVADIRSASKSFINALEQEFGGGFPAIRKELDKVTDAYATNIARRQLVDQARLAASDKGLAGSTPKVRLEAATTAAGKVLAADPRLEKDINKALNELIRLQRKEFFGGAGPGGKQNKGVRDNIDAVAAAAKTVFTPELLAAGAAGKVDVKTRAEITEKLQAASGLDFTADPKNLNATEAEYLRRVNRFIDDIITGALGSRYGRGALLSAPDVDRELDRTVRATVAESERETRASQAATESDRQQRLREEALVQAATGGKSGRYVALEDDGPNRRIGRVRGDRIEEVQPGIEYDRAADAIRAEERKHRDAARALSEYNQALAQARAGLLQLGSNNGFDVFDDPTSGQRRIFSRPGAKGSTREVEQGTTEFDKLSTEYDVRRTRVAQRDLQGPEARSLFERGLAGFFGSSQQTKNLPPDRQTAFGNLAGQLGVVLKYIGLFQGAFFAINAVGAGIGQIKDYSDSVAELDNAIQALGKLNEAFAETEKASQSFQGNIAQISRYTGENLGDGMDVAVRGIRAFGDELGKSGASLEGFSTSFLKTVSQSAVITNKSLTDAAGDAIAIGKSFGGGVQGLSQITDVLATAKTIGGDSKQIAQGLASIGTSASEAGFSMQETANIISLVQGRLDESGQAASTRLSRIFSIVGGTTGTQLLGELGLPTEGSVRDRLESIIAVYDELSPALQGRVRNALGGTSNVRELIPLLREGKSALNIDTVEGQGLKQFDKTTQSIVGIFKQISGDLSNIVTGLGRSGLGDLIGVIAKGLEKVLDVTARIIDLFARLTDVAPWLKVVVAAGILLKTLKLISAIANTSFGQPISAALGAVTSSVGGALVPSLVPQPQQQTPAPNTGPATTYVAPGSPGGRAPYVYRTPTPDDFDDPFSSPPSVVISPDDFDDPFRENGDTGRAAKASAKGIGAAGSKLSGALNSAAAGVSSAAAALKGKAIAKLDTIVDADADVDVDVDADSGGRRRRGGGLGISPRQLVGGLALGGAAALIGVGVTVATDIARYKREIDEARKLVDDSPAEATASALREQIQSIRSAAETLDKEQKGISAFFTSSSRRSTLKESDSLARFLEERSRKLEQEQKTKQGQDFDSADFASVETVENKFASLSAEGLSAAEAIGVLTQSLVGLNKGADLQDTVQEFVAGFQAAEDAVESALKGFNFGGVTPDSTPGKTTANSRERLGGVGGVGRGAPAPVAAFSAISTDYNIPAEDQRKLSAALEKALADGIPSVVAADGIGGKRLDTKDLEVKVRAAVEGSGILDSFKGKGQEAYDTAVDAIVQSLSTSAGNALFAVETGTPISGDVFAALTKQLDAAVSSKSYSIAQQIKLFNDFNSATREAIATGQIKVSDEVLAALSDSERSAATLKLGDIDRIRAAAQSRTDSQAEYARLGNDFIREAVTLLTNAGDSEGLISLLNGMNTAERSVARATYNKVKAGIEAAVEAAQSALDSVYQLALVAFEAALAAERQLSSAADGMLALAGSAAKSSPDYQAQLEVLETAKKKLGELPTFDELGDRASSSDDGKYTKKPEDKNKKEKKEEPYEDIPFLKRVAEAVRVGGNVAKASAELFGAERELARAKKGSADYYKALARVYEAQNSLADAYREYAVTAAKLGSDITNPVEQARIELEAAQRKLREDTAAGKSNEVLNEDRLAVKTAQANVEASQFQQNLAAIQTAEELGRITHQAYIKYLKSEQTRLLAIAKRTQQQQEQLDTIEKALQAAYQEFAGQFNISDIKLPTIYEVRRYIAEAAKATTTSAVAAGAATNAGIGTASVSTGNTTNVTITVNGADTGQVIAVINKALGPAALGAASIVGGKV